MYMQGFKCMVTGETGMHLYYILRLLEPRANLMIQLPGNRKIAKAKPPVWCKGDPSKCRRGAKQMIVFNRT
jgi:hypothetical protein